jgi:hypothetical protein
MSSVPAFMCHDTVYIYGMHVCVSEDVFRGISASEAVVTGMKLALKIHTALEKGPVSE